MRGVVSSASAYGRQRLPASLMQRLELMQYFALAAQAGGQARGLPPTSRTPRVGAHAIVLAWFSLGVLTSGALGAATIVGARALASGQSPLAPFGWRAWAKVSPEAPSPRHDAGWDKVQVVIDRSGGPRAPLPLQVTGADAAPLQVVMQGLPPGVTPSRGTAVGPSTWVLDRSDLGGLFLTLDASAPAAFDFKVGVSVAPGAAAAGSVVQVRLIGDAEQKQAALPGGAGGARTASPAPSAMSDGAEIDAANPSPAAGPAAVARTAGLRGGAQRRPAPVAADATGAGAQPTEGRSWPEGASGLGAVPRSPAPSWWQMPPPTWSPFLVGQERP
ncbi:MAG TPA: hypothetical protein VGF29_00175 [Hyphomicrobiaceae bacterium]